MYVPLSRFLLRAPLLPAAALTRATAALETHPLGPMAIAIASPTLAEAAPGPARTRAIGRYARRAAFRPTPSGLWAGVCVGALGARTDVATGRAEPRLAPSWARLAALGRALLDEPEVRDRVRLRAAPSVAVGDGAVRWTAPGEPHGEPREAVLDGPLTAILATASGWTRWDAVRARAARATRADADQLDELLLALIDEGLLQTDLVPPFIGPAPEAYLAARLAALGLPEAAGFATATGAFAAGDLPAGRAALASLPGQAARDVHAVLLHRPRRPPQIEREAVARAARLTPLLVRLQEAMASPAAERSGLPALADALDASTEIFGAGAFDLEALAAGGYGVGLDGDGAPGGAAPPPALLVLLVDAIAAAARAGRREAELPVAALDAALADLASTPLPATVEIFLAPTRRPKGARPGTGWLLGLHGPAGASWGRFAHAVGAPLAEACAELAQAEQQARPAEARVDIGFAPSAALADLCAHPPIRRRALALSGWSAAGDDLRAADLALVADPAEPEALALRGRDGAAIVPSPLWRVRSATAAPGAERLLAAWSLQRQHAPWAFTPGPLAGLGFIPRLVVDGFVIAPASWRLPAALRDGRATPAALARWRREAGVPSLVQVGHEDELYPVDLRAREAGADLKGHDRVFEIWPPLEDTVDRDGRRVEIVAAAVDDGTPPPAPPADLALVPPPQRTPALAGWRTFKLFGAAGRQDDLLLGAVVPAVHAARRAGQIDAWFFLRYVDGPGQRPHLRLRVRGQPAAFERRLRGALDAARRAGAFTVLETGDYFPERGRFEAETLDGLHAIFQSDSETAAALLGAPELEPTTTLARLYDALAGGLDLDLVARHGLARQRRDAAEAWTGVDDEARREADAAFRRHGRALRAALAGPPAAADPARAPLARHGAQVATAARRWTAATRARLLPTLLHLTAVRFAGPDPELERLGYTFWERALGGLRRSP